MTANQASSRATHEGKGASNLARFLLNRRSEARKPKIEPVNDEPRPAVREP